MCTHWYTLFRQCVHRWVQIMNSICRIFCWVFFVSFYFERRETSVSVEQRANKTHVTRRKRMLKFTVFVSSFPRSKKWNRTIRFIWFRSHCHFTYIMFFFLSPHHHCRCCFAVSGRWYVCMYNLQHIRYAVCDMKSKINKTRKCRLIFSIGPWYYLFYKRKFISINIKFQLGK